MLFDPAFLVAAMGVEAMKPLTGQGSLFGPQKTGREAYEEAVKPQLNSTVEPADRKRLATKYQLIMARMERGPATGLELNAIAFSFGQRLEEAKRAGVKWGRERMEGGVHLYFLTKHQAEAERMLGREIS